MAREVRPQKTRGLRGERLYQKQYQTFERQISNHIGDTLFKDLSGQPHVSNTLAFQDILLDRSP